jgi:hypothetical protein
LEERVLKAPAHSGILLSAKTTFHCRGRFRVYDVEAIGLSSEMRGVNVKHISLLAQVLPAASDGLQAIANIALIEHQGCRGFGNVLSHVAVNK